MKRLISFLKNQTQKKIIIIGDIMLDEYFLGTISRISPEAPVPVLKHEEIEWCLGGAANVAANCKHIGLDVTLVGVVGAQCASAQKVFEKLSELAISTNTIAQSTTRVTTVKKRFLAQNQQILRMDSESSHALTDIEWSQLQQLIREHVSSESMILVSDYAKGVVTNDVMRFIVSLARERGCTIIVDPKGPDFNKYAGVDYIKPNAKEFAQMVSFFNLDPAVSIEENARKISNLLSLRGIIITRGERGISYVSQTDVIHVPAQSHDVYDLTGAGDTVAAFLALGLAQKLSMHECLILANRAAAVAISHRKTYAVSLDELLDRSIELSEKIYDDWAQLKIELDWVRAGGKKVVITNGCFDILHPGHVHVLKEAKQQGDILVVALNTDASVQRLKGPTRPLNTLQDRAMVMAALGVVDFVVAFDQDTPLALIEYLKPDVLVKGGDYKKEQIAGYDFITAHGGNVHIVDYIIGVSTTALVKKIGKTETVNR